MRRTVAWVFFCAVAIGSALGWYQYTHHQRDRTDKAASERSQNQVTEVDGRVKAMAKEHDAVTDWEVALSRSTKLRELFSVDVEQSIMQKDRRPILFLGSPINIRSVDGKLFALFEGDIGDLFYGDEIDFELECDESAANAIRAKGMLEDFDVVALISSIETTDSDRNVGGEIELHRQFLCKGRCLALLSVDLDYAIERDKAMHEEASR